MKKTISICMTLFLAFSILVSYPSRDVMAASEKSGQTLGWVDGTPQALRNAQNLGVHMRVMTTTELQARATHIQAIGDERTFWAADLTKKTSDPNYFYQVTAVLRLSRDHSDYYIAKDQTVSDSTLGILANAFEGNYNKMHDQFGNEPDIDKNGKVIFLLLDIRDNYSKTGTYTGGYFDPVNEDPDYTYSNKAEMMYIDTNPSNPDSIGTQGTLIHEFQHMIHYNYNPQSIEGDTWINEGLSDLAPYLMGLGHNMNHVNEFVKNPDIKLTVWESDPKVVVAHYGAAYMYMLYLYEQYPSTNSTPLTHWLEQSVQAGVTNIEGALVNAGYSGVTFDQIFANWSVALEVNQRSIDPRWGFKDLSYNLAKNSQTYWSGTLSVGGDSDPSPVSHTGNDYIQVNFPNPLDLNHTFQFSFSGEGSNKYDFFTLADNHVNQVSLSGQSPQTGLTSLVPGVFGQVTMGIGRGNDDSTDTQKYSIQIGPAHNVVFLIDDTGSMSDDIDQVKQTVQAKVNDMASEKDNIYTLITFKDDVTYHGTTSDPVTFNNWINALYAWGGDDCPEDDYGAMHEAASRLRGGDVWLMTDATPSGSFADSLLAAADLLKSGLRLHVTQLGNCETGAFSLSNSGSSCLNANDPNHGPSQFFSVSGTAAVSPLEMIAQQTGGHYFAINVADLGAALDTTLYEMSTTGILAWQKLDPTADPGTALDLTLDDGLTQTGFLLELDAGSSGQLSLTRPNGTQVLDGDADASHIRTGSSDYYWITTPVAGKWHITAIGSGTGRLTVSGNTTINLTYIGNPSLPYQKTAELKAYLPGTFTNLSFKLRNTDTNLERAVALYDDGAHDDAQAGDGIYAGNFTPDELASYYLNVAGTSVDIPTFSRTSSVRLTVQPINVSVTPTRYLLPGDTVQHIFTLTNLGSTQDTYSLFSSSTMGWSDLSGIPAATILDPGESITFTVPVQIPITAGQGMGDMVSLNATSQSDPGINDSVSVSAISDPQSLAVPILDHLEQSTVTVGTRNWGLIVRGSNFRGDSVIYWNEIPLVTELTDPTNLTASVPNSWLDQVGTAAIFVENTGFSTRSVNTLTLEIVPAIVYLPMVQH